VAWSAISGADSYDVSLDGGVAISAGSNTYYDWTLPAADGSHAFTVRSVDSLGNTSSWSASCAVTLDQTAPTVDAGSNRSKNTNFVQDDSSATDSTSGIASYAWTKVSGPGSITFTNNSDLQPDVSASADGTYVLRLTVTDNAGNSANDTFTLIWDTTGPTVDAGDNKTTNASFTQSSSSASDGGVGIASYAWTKVSGPGTVTFTNNTDLHPQISAGADGTYVLQLLVTDNLGNTASDTFTLVWSTPPTPANDNDGATDTEEQTAPNSGDANNDGQQDAEQKDVTSFVNPSTNTYAVLENTNNCQNTNVSQQRISDLAKADGSYVYPAGLMNFTLVCGAPGMTVTVNQYFYGISTTNLVARKYDSRTNTYSTISDAIISLVTLDGQQVIKISYNITDGGPLDEDGLVNGTVVDPSGPAVLSTSVVAPNTGLQQQSMTMAVASGFAGICALAGGLYTTRKKVHKQIR